MIVSVPFQTTGCLDLHRDFWLHVLCVASHVQNGLLLQLTALQTGRQNFASAASLCCGPGEVDPVHYVQGVHEWECEDHSVRVCIVCHQREKVGGWGHYRHGESLKPASFVETYSDLSGISI